MALSLNIDPRKLRRNLRSLGRLKPRFDEGQEFNDRIFLVERSLADIGVINSVVSYYEGREPMVRRDSVFRWAFRIGWSLPAELLESPVAQDFGSPPTDHPRISGAASSDSPPAKPQIPGRSGRKKGLGSADDAEHLRTMLGLLATGQATSVYAAARQVAETITPPRQSRTADVNRLRRKFAREHGTEPPEGKSWSDVESELDIN